MPDNKELLTSVVYSMIANKPEEAAVTIHDYFVPKMREIAGLGSAEAAPADLDPDATPTE